jgi:hypothetical protein
MAEITIDNLSAKSNDLAINAGYSNMKIGYNNNFAFMISTYGTLILNMKMI